MKFLILLCYYRRPNMVLNALRSIQRQTVGMDRIELAFVDDSGPEHPLDLSILQEIPCQHTVYLVGDTEEDKQARGSRFGHFWNLACAESDADIALMLCDDDALHPEYLEKLSAWFEAHPEFNYCHSHVIPFDPFTVRPEDANYVPGWWLNHDRMIAPSCTVDASQVAWRLPAMKESGVEFPSPQTANLDATVYTRMYEAWGLCPPTGFVGQYKGVYGTALTYRQGREYQVLDIPEPPSK